MGRQRFGYTLGLIMVLGCFCFGNPMRREVSWAEVHITPDVTAEQEYTSNFYRSQLFPAAVWVTRVSPGINLQALTERSRLDLNYHFNYYWYHDINRDLHTSRLDYPGQDLNLFAATQFFSRLTLAFNENYILTREPASADVFSQIVAPDKYERNRITPTLAYDIGEKGEAKAGYRNEIFNYLQRTLPSHEDSTENRGILTLTYHLNSTNHLDLESQVWYRNYQGGINSDYASYQTMLIYRREFSSYLEGHAAAGVNYRHFYQNDLGDVDLFAFHMGLTGHTEQSKLYFSFERNMNDFTVGDEYFFAYLLRLTGEYLFWDRVRAYVGGFYQWGAYFESPRKDKVWNASVGVGYLFLDKRLEVSVEYDRNMRNSNEQGFSYNENQVYFRISAHHDFGGK
jgi:hypothetical protein